MLRTIAKALVSPMIAPALMFIGIGTGLIPNYPDPKIAEYTPFWSNVFGSELNEKAFLTFIGVSKVFGVMSMWKSDSKLGNIACLTPSLCALYMHKEMGDPWFPAAFMSVAISYLLLTDPEKKKAKGN